MVTRHRLACSAWAALTRRHRPFSDPAAEAAAAAAAAADHLAAPRPRWAPPAFSSSSTTAAADPDAATSNEDTSRSDDVRGSGRRLAFVDRVHCTAIGGTGGAGCAAFWRSKASGKFGPPDGGNGGRGGDVVIEAIAGLKSLRGIRPLQRAGPGRAGGPQKRHGPRGADCTVGVPPGTVVYELQARRGGGDAAAAAAAWRGVEAGNADADDDYDDGWWRGGGGGGGSEAAPTKSSPPPPPPSGLRLVADLATPGARYVAAPGGAGGTGNAALPKSVERARRRAVAAATPGDAAAAGGGALAGAPGAVAALRLELRSLADAGLVGPPNAGKSTLLRALSGARPRVGAYPFTTTRPHLGVLTAGPGGSSSAASSAAAAAAAAAAAPPLTLADVPGLLPGAAGGVGLGHDFLRHVSRCAALVLVIDVSAAVDGRGAAAAAAPAPAAAAPAAALHALLGELAAYDPSLPTRPTVVAANKVDATPDGGASAVAALTAAAPPGCVAVVATSGRAGLGLEDLAAAVREAVGRAEE